MRAEHGAFGQAEASGADRTPSIPLAEGPDLQAGAEEIVAVARVAAAWA